MDILPEPHITLACCSCLDVCLFVPVCGSCSAADNNEVSEYLNSNNLQLFGPFLYVFWEIVHERRGDIRQLSWFNVCLFS